MYDRIRENEIRKPRKTVLPVFSLIFALFIGLFSTGLLYPSIVGSAKSKDFTLEPKAGEWQTWVLESGSQYRPPQPPGKRTTQQEIKKLEALQKERGASMQKITYWTGVTPSYRWNRIASDLLVDTNANTLVANRYLAILNTAMADSMVAAWDAKYTYQRQRPSIFDRDFDAAVSVPKSPSYPSEDAVAAGAASVILSHLMPDHAANFEAKAQEVMHIVQVAGLNYPSDVEIGYELGRKVGEAAIARAKSDGSDAQWDGQMPTGPGYWTGQNPALPTMGDWKTWVLESGDQFRPADRYAYDSAELAAEMDELRALVEQRTGKKSTHGFFWEFGAGGVRNSWFWNEHAGRKILETGLGSNPPRSARALALMNVALYDAGVACWDAKYEYWSMRPFQLDAEFKTMFPSPNHPSFPSAHSCLSKAASDVLAYLFPNDAAEFDAYAVEAGEARLWAGLHVRSDVTAGNQIGHDVAGAVIEYAENDGSR